MFLGKPVVMYRKEDGTPVALSDTCPHRRAPLHKGEVVGDEIQCPYHGIRFNCAGKATWAQAQDRLPAAMGLTSYPLVEKDAFIWIWMGDPALADESRIFSTWSCNHPDWATIGGYYHIKAAAMLAVDNLMDLSHTAFVHRASVGSEDDLNPELVWERGEDWVKGTRVARGIVAAPHQRVYGADCLIDQTKEMRWVAPYNCNVDISSTEAGKPYGQGMYSEKFLTYNLLTPETATTFHYFWANTRDFQVDNPEFQAIHQTNGEQLISEDKWMLEETQRATDLAPDVREVDLAADAGGLQARRMFRRILDAENEMSAGSAAALSAFVRAAGLPAAGPPFRIPACIQERSS